MSRQPLFAGLIVDENDHLVGTALVGDEPCYVIDDTGLNAISHPNRWTGKSWRGCGTKSTETKDY